MNLIPPRPARPALVYPEDDGLPMSNNTKQGRWIVVFYDNLRAQFAGYPDIFVALDLLWYPVEGELEVCNAPDVLVVFGRHKGERGSYKQWEEDNVPVTVAIEILSPSNSGAEVMAKYAFYEEHGVEEYYLYDPDSNRLHVYLRKGEALLRVRKVQDFVSPRLGIRFDLSGDELVIYRSDGQRFLSFEELEEARKAAERRADQEKLRADQAQQRADQAETQRDQQKHRAEQAETQRNQAQQRADQTEQRMAWVVELSRKALAGQATPEELQELQRLLSER